MRTPDAVPLAVDSTPPVRGFVHRPGEASGWGLVLTHGAGSNCNAPLLVAVAHGFAEAGFTVLRCDLPYRQKRPHGPPFRGEDRLDREGLQNAIAALKQLDPQLRRILLGGHSYGGRQASLLAAEDAQVADGLLLLSYPLHPPHRPAQLRTAHFSALHTPALFVHGTRDPFATAEELAAALALIPGRTTVVSFEGAGHDLRAGRSRGAEHVRDAGARIRDAALIFFAKAFPES